ncbi:hypothetical protein RKD52_002738 [Metabacillus sp. SLBN-84]
MMSEDRLDLAVLEGRDLGLEDRGLVSGDRDLDLADRGSGLASDVHLGLDYGRPFGFYPFGFGFPFFGGLLGGLALSSLYNPYYYGYGYPYYGYY